MPYYGIIDIGVLLFQVMVLHLLGAKSSLKLKQTKQDLKLSLYIYTSNGSWCIGIKGEMSGTVCVTFTWDIYIYMSCL